MPGRRTDSRFTDAAAGRELQVQSAHGKPITGVAFGAEAKLVLSAAAEGAPRSWTPAAGAIYAGLQWFWLVGVVAPVVTWFLARRNPRSIFRYVNVPLFFGGSGLIPPATTYTYLCWGACGTVFNYFIKRRWTGWWMQYNYITSAALDCGLIVATIVIFFTLYLTSAAPPSWYGNTAVYETLDQTGMAIKTFMAPGEKFGPTTWP